MLSCSSSARDRCGRILVSYRRRDVISSSENKSPLYPSVALDIARCMVSRLPQTILADGQLSKARTEQLKEVQQQLGLNDAAAQKVVQSITSTKMAGAIDAAVRQGKLTVEEVRQLKESGVEIETMVAKKVSGLQMKA